VTLLGFGYLNKRNLFLLFLIVTLISTLFSITAFSLLGLYNGFNAYLGEGDNIVAIYSTTGSTPFSGLVPSYLAESINTLKGVLASSPEILGPCVVKGEAVFARGAILDELTKLNPLTVVEGNLTLTDFDSAIVGKSLAERLYLKTGDQILVQGTLTESYLELHVEGVYESHTPLDDELVVPLYAGQCLRAVDYGQVTLIRVKIDRTQVTPETIYEEVAKEASQEASQPSQGSQEQPAQSGVVLWPRLSFLLKNVGVVDAQTFMKSYLERYGVTVENVLVLSAMVFVFSSASLALAITTLTRQHKHEIEILQSLGASKRTLKTDFLVKTLTVSLAASACGAILAMLALTAMWGTGYLQVLSHRISIQFNPIVIVLNFALVSALVSVAILKSLVKK
jgi:ABC-type lipoprotein release transport system permease subunit